ncbi:class I SAM-dependent methyltransferase [Pseudobacteriovorax antillogorgiicola]|uniref:23S rRNA (Cytosine1962-C5)-methyltransferase n=1 Tax=Pseudobacteriovorax antillogorgiicola TaxID=1513793 RepID=A0A1Y6CK34_9BACT|nr:class I SAM-dependent methyltransferase [Pseudobacteriovorax antillogorgiicola]TCS46386.1 23S rRNA (cytosine1962-C5)-methyltransferase [Pseudobacteriovorax antillogorgiicola]SMF68661.1 23S rRNA (cytosine1962-C5)-methyltransferase [Pseudobacteriovorax antillogorgiicola]
MTEFYSRSDMEKQGKWLANRVLKNFKHRRKLFKKQGTDAFRLYDWDIPEVRAVVDWYDGNLVVAEYVRQQTEGIPWLETVAGYVAEALGVAEDKVFLKKRQTRPGTWARRYERLDQSQHQVIVAEQGLRFIVNLRDYLDTGLFLDHRQTRAMVRDQARGKSILNLFAYTGSFTCYGAQGEATNSLTVDLSSKYIQWAQDNLALNELTAPQHQFLVADVLAFLDDAIADGRTWDLIILDPPSFSTRKNAFEFDIQRDHPWLLEKVQALLSAEGSLYFSTNHARFEMAPTVKGFKDISGQTVPPDFKSRRPHQCFLYQCKGTIS